MNNSESPSPKDEHPSYENSESPSPKDELCQLWLQLASGSGEVENIKI
jgi:hypothetical protein